MMGGKKIFLTFVFFEEEKMRFSSSSFVSLLMLEESTSVEKEKKRLRALLMNPSQRSLSFSLFSS